MIRATFKSLLSRKLRLILSGMGVLLGVMFVSGAFVLTDTLGRSFDQLFTGIFANTDVQVSAQSKLSQNEFEDDDMGGATVPAAVLDTIRAVDGVAAVTGVAASDGAHVIGANGKVVASIGPPRFGADWPSESQSAVLREGRGPSADTEIAVNASLAKAAGVKVGDQVKVITPAASKAQPFTLVGVFGFAGGQDTQGGSQVVAFTQPVAQRLMLGAPDVFSSVDVKAAAGVSDDTLRDRVAAAMGDGYQVKTGKQLTDAAVDSFTQVLKFFNYILIGFACVALFVAVFLILNTFSILIAQRTRELALMRAIGAARGQVVGSVLLEAAVVGLIASMLGLGAGIGVGALLAQLFGSVGAGGLQLASVGVPAAAIISSFVVGIGVTVLAALIPALRASRIAPVAAMREAATSDRPLTKVTVGGLAVLAVGAGGLTLGLTGNAGGQDLWAILGGVLFTFIGVALLTPLISKPVAGLIGQIFSWSVPGRLGRLNAGRNPRRTAITASALMIGIALIVGITTVLTSAKQSITSVADQQAKVDLIISSDGGATFDRSVLDRSANLAGVGAVTGLYENPAQVDGDQTYVGAFTDMAPVPGMFTLATVAGTINAVGDGQVIVDETTATEKGLSLGSPVTVQLSRGDPLPLTVSGIYGKSDLFGGYILPVSAVDNFTVGQPGTGFIQASDPSQVDTIKSHVDTFLADNPEVTVGNRAEYIAQQTSSSDQVLLMVQILLALAILIAVLGVINTMLLSVLERTRELGLLRAVGLGRGQTVRMVTVEAVVISMFGAVLGIAVGAGLGATVVRALRDEGITELALPWNQMALYLVLSVFVGVVVAVLPAFRASRVNVLQAIAYE